MPAQKLKQMLDERNVKYISINHSPAYTARETAASTFVPRREFAKTIIVDLDGEKVMAVVSASRHVDLEALSSLARASAAREPARPGSRDARPPQSNGCRETMVSARSGPVEMMSAGAPTSASMRSR